MTIKRLAAALALAAGVLLLLVSALTVVSVSLRWLTSQPVRGDVELVQLGGGVAVMLCLAYGTLRRSNIFVDSLTAWLPARVNAALDALWQVAWGAAALLLAERMAVGAMEAHGNGTTTFGLLGMPIWGAVAAGALGFALTGLVALRFAWRRPG